MFFEQRLFQAVSVLDRPVIGPYCRQINANTRLKVGNMNQYFLRQSAISAYDMELYHISQCRSHAQSISNIGSVRVLSDELGYTRKTHMIPVPQPPRTAITSTFCVFQNKQQDCAISTASLHIHISHATRDITIVTVHKTTPVIPQKLTEWPTVSIKLFTKVLGYVLP